MREWISHQAFYLDEDAISNCSCIEAEFRDRSFRIAMGKQLQFSIPIPYEGLSYGDEFLYISKTNAKANAGNLKIVDTSDFDNVSDSIEKLIKTYRAPSVEQSH